MTELTVDLQDAYEGPGTPTETRIQSWAGAAWGGGSLAGGVTARRSYGATSTAM